MKIIRLSLFFLLALCTLSAHPQSRAEFKGGLWLINDLKIITSPLIVGKNFEVEYSLNLFRCDHSNKMCETPSVRTQGFSTASGESNSFSLFPKSLRPVVTSLTEGKTQKFVATFYSSPEKILPQNYLVKLDLEYDDGYESYRLGSPTWLPQQDNGDGGSESELDKAKNLVNKFFSAYFKAQKEEDSSLISDYVSGRAEYYYGLLLNRLIEDHISEGIKVPSYSFRVYDFKVVTNPDLPFRKQLEIKFLLDRVQTLKYEGKVQNSDASEVAYTAILETPEGKPWKIETLYWDEPETPEFPSKSVESKKKLN